MKANKIILASLIGLSFLANLVACSKSSNNNTNYVTGNGSINGQTFNATDTLAGQQTTVIISGLNYSSSGANSSYYGSTGTVYTTVSVNGNSASIPVNVQYPGSTAPQPQNLGGYSVYSTARCVDTTCTNVAVVLWIGVTQTYGYSSTTTQLMQVGLIENMSTQVIRSAAEQVGYEQQSPILPTADQLVTNMESHMSN